MDAYPRYTSDLFNISSPIYPVFLSLTFVQYFLCSSFDAAYISPSHPIPSHLLSSSFISSRTYIFILAQQQVFESLFECGIAQCVTSWVDGRVDITQPVADRPHGVRDTGLTEGGNQHHDIIRCPCNDESQEDGKDGLGYLQKKRESRRLDLSKKK